MKKNRIWISFLLLAALLLSGCGMYTVDKMYALPKRSDAYQRLQVAIDSAMTGLEYAAPLSGENRQTVQMADLDGDGTDEFLLFAKDSSETPLKILIFRQDGEEYRLMEIISGLGSAFEQVEYMNMDGHPGVELLVGRQLSDQVLRTLSVYTFASGTSQQLMSSGYHKFLSCDLDYDKNGELMVIHPGESESVAGFAVLHDYKDGEMRRSAEADLSEPAESIKRIMINRLSGGESAVYIASSVDGSAIITDIFAIKYGKFTNISLSAEAGNSVKTLRNYYVYADDIDDDGILELPRLTAMESGGSGAAADRQYLIRWYAMDIDGREVDKMVTFHNFDGGWYLQLGQEYAESVTVATQENQYGFCIRQEDGTDTLLFTVSALTGANREEAAYENNSFPLHRAEGVVYAARLEAISASYGITQEILTDCFHMIHHDWKTGET